MAALRQFATFKDNIQQFECVAGMVPKLLEQAYLGNITNELQEEIILWIRNPNDIKQPMHPIKKVQFSLFYLMDKSIA